MVNYDFDLGLRFNFELKTPPGQPAGNEVLFKYSTCGTRYSGVIVL